MASTKRSDTFDVNADAIWDVITDYENYPKFVDGCTSATIVKRKGNTVIVDYEVNMVKKISYTLEHKETPQKKMVWKMTDGTFLKHNKGSWDIKAKGDKVDVNYAVDIGFPLLVPKSFVDTLVSANLPKMMKSFEKRAKGVAKKASAKTPAAKKKVAKKKTAKKAKKKTSKKR